MLYQFKTGKGLMLYEISYKPSRKYSLRVVEKRLEYFTNSRFLCSNNARALGFGTRTDTAATASSTFLIVLAISLQYKVIH